MHLSAIASLTFISFSAFGSAGGFHLTSKVSVAAQSSLLTLESHKCTGYCGGPTCGDVCSCSRLNFCFKGPSHGPDLYRIYNQPAGQVVVYGEAVGVSNARPGEDGPQIEWKLESLVGDRYQIVSNMVGKRAAYSSQNPAWPLVVSNNKTLPVEWIIQPVPEKDGAFTIQLADSEVSKYDLFWTAPDVGNTIRLQVGNGKNNQQWRIQPLP
ncbi:hypothetical protein MVEN_01997400 [Mycena venus]|uniref:Ricin B lectin domain-containing protein n=1 Tax=Mycena venus TaxID=2733690 RepID=A0A8H6XF06_9AGAR|nr:hypothetical protein MVEN_01997400 [Mycena venus]